MEGIAHDFEVTLQTYIDTEADNLEVHLREKFREWPTCEHLQSLIDKSMFEIRTAHQDSDEIIRRVVQEFKELLTTVAVRVNAYENAEARSRIIKCLKNWVIEINTLIDE